MGVSSSSSVSQVLLLSKHGSSHENKVFTFPAGSGWWLFQSLTLSLQTRNYASNRQFRVLKVMEAAFLWHQPCVTDPVSRGLNDWCTTASLVLINTLILPALQLVSAQGPISHNPALQQMLLSAGYHGSHDKAKKEGSHKAWAVPCSGRDQEVMLLHAVSSPCVSMVRTATALAAQMGL